MKLFTKKYLLILLPFFYSLSYGQVTIGSTIPPIKGALLDLKQKEDITGGINAEKGFLLPRVELTSIENLYPMFPEGYDKTENTKHIGLVVYNVNTDMCNNLFAGAHVWDGNKWILFSEREDEKYVDILIDKRGDEEIEYYIAHYKSGKTDAGWWMLENLRTTKWPDGTDDNLKYIDPLSDDNQPEELAAYTHPMMNPNLYNQYFYNYKAATKYAPMDESTTKVQGLCPNGWHIPSQDEWKLLLQVIKENPCYYSTSDIAANAGANLQKPKSTPLGTSRPKEEGGFNAVLQGMVTHLGYIQHEDEYGNYWARYPSTMVSGAKYLGVATFIHNNATTIGFLNITTAGGIAHYVPLRCVKDR